MLRTAASEVCGDALSVVPAQAGLDAGGSAAQDTDVTATHSTVGSVIIAAATAVRRRRPESIRVRPTLLSFAATATCRGLNDRRMHQRSHRHTMEKDRLYDTC
ncbi:hypothetical protein GCM10010170_076610 [Dactylosporangium salmoneum]|uniref:Uncharacterized protein n=1 Tax=Dactylosporangium salmoneum TaxID=53361 RepID=A0ABN3HC54_9ACTN